MIKIDVWSLHISLFCLNLKLFYGDSFIMYLIGFSLITIIFILKVVI